MSDLIDRQDAIDTVTRYCNQYDLRELLADIEVLPSAEAVLKGTYEQVRWERDTALEQLKELGYSLGEKPRKSDLISRQKAINTAEKMYSVCDTGNITDYKDLVIEALEVAIESLKQNQWIPCESITEPIDREVLCCDKYGNELIGWLDYNDYYECWVCESDECVMYDTVAYMEKPKPWKG